MTATNEYSIDIHDTAPADCPRCAPVFPMATPFACLSHTCPDCGLITWNLTNDAGELIHRCPEGTVLNGGY